MELNEIKKKYSWFGVGYFVFLVAMYIAVLAFSFIFHKFLDAYSDNSYLTYLVGLLPIWLVGFPAAFLVVKNMPVKAPEQHDLGIGNFFKAYTIITFFSIGLNIVGIILAFILKSITGLTINNSTIDLISEQEVLPTLIFAVILGPIFEELAFRKVLIDRLGQYNKMQAIILSGVMFGLFHTNLYQLLYATGIGMLLAYVYTKTGRIRYTIGLHMTMNFVHGLLPVFLLKNLDLDALSNLDVDNIMDPEVQQQALKLYMNPYFLLYMLYAFVIFMLFVIGIIFFFLSVKKINVDDPNPVLKKEDAFKTIYLNVGMILFIITVVGLTIYEIAIMQ